MTDTTKEAPPKDIGGVELIETAGEGLKTVTDKVLFAITNPWTPLQIVIVAVLFVCCWYLSKLIEPRLEERLRNAKMNSGFMRVSVALLRRIEWVLFVPACWVAYQIASSITFPWNTLVLRTAYILAFAWLVINVLSRVIHSRQLARLIAVAAWVVVALSIFGYLKPVTETLDALAFHMGDIRISALSVIKTIVLLAFLTWLAGNTGQFADTRIRAMPDLTPSLQVLLGKLVKIFLVVMAFVIALTSAGIDLTAFAVFSGAIGVGLGFGLQKVVSNFISGVIILLDKSIKPGDTISLGETFGWIRELRSRFVSVVTRDGREFLIPNEDFITQQVINWSFTDKLVRLDVDFGVAYNSNPHEVSRLVVEVIEKVERVSKAKKPVCWLTEFGDSSLNFRTRFWISDPQNGLTNIRGIAMLAIWDVFQENEIEIPYPHRELLVRTPIEVVPQKSKSR